MENKYELSKYMSSLAKLGMKTKLYLMNGYQMVGKIVYSISCLLSSTLMAHSE